MGKEDKSRLGRMKQVKKRNQGWDKWTEKRREIKIGTNEFSKESIKVGTNEMSKEEKSMMRWMKWDNRNQSRDGWNEKRREIKDGTNELSKEEK